MKIRFTFRTPFNQKAAHNKSLKRIITLEFTIPTSCIFLKLQSQDKLVTKWQHIVMCIKEYFIFPYWLICVHQNIESTFPHLRIACMCVHACTHMEGKKQCSASCPFIMLQLHSVQKSKSSASSTNVPKEETAEWI